MTDSSAPAEELLTPGSVLPYLVARGLLPSGAEATVTRLAGGVSNVVLGVETVSSRLVVKQAMGRLDVPEQWLATRRRTLTEAAGLRVAGALTPAHVPVPIDVDPEALALVIPAAPEHWRPLKDDLIDGVVARDLVRGLARVLATWHTATLHRSELTAACDDPEAFRQLRTDPFHSTVAVRHPSVAEQVLSCRSELVSARTCLVHGDFSPKNILSGPGGYWVIDFEVAHVGAPVFDVAFFLTHLLLKSAFRPAHLPAYKAAAGDFLTEYQRGTSASPGLEIAALTLHVGALLLARVDGLSPASYLAEAQRKQVRDLALSLLLRPPVDVQEAYDRLEAHKREQ